MPKSIREREIKIRLSNAEHERISILSRGKAIAPYIREAALGAQELDLTPLTPAEKADPELIQQIRLYGNNLNQISKKINSRDSFSFADKQEFKTQLKRIERALDGIATAIETKS